MEMVKGRELRDGQRIFVYFNLHKKCFSVKDVRTGLVVAHTDEISMRDVTFKVSESGRQRVLSEKRKNVHAGVLGEYWEGGWGTIGFNTVTYNPYKAGHFYSKDNNEKVTKGDWVKLIDKKILVGYRDGQHHKAR